MAALSLRRLSNPENLQKIDPRNLAALLHPHQAYFARRGIAIPPPGSPDVRLDHASLVQVFLAPDREMPLDLVESLHIVNELASPSGMDALLEAAREQEIAIERLRTATPLDVAVRACLQDRAFVESVHQRHALLKTRAYTYFTATGPAAALNPVPEAALDALRRDLDDYYAEHNRGRHCRIHVFHRGGKTWFTVRHGDAFKRAVDIETKPAAVFTYRPECFSTMVYVAESGELGIHASSKRELDLYRKLMGRHFFGFEEFFCGPGRFTLAPLLTKGPASLACSDVSGIEWVKLVEVRYERALPNHPREIRCASDLFDSYPHGIVPSDARLLGAGFKMKFRGTRSARRLGLYPPNEARHLREGDAILTEQWLQARGFLRPQVAAGADVSCGN